MSVSTHVLDAVAGRPAVGVPVQLEHDGAVVAERVTDADGRVADLLPDSEPGVYRLSFDVESYAPDAFFPEITITFRITDPGAHHHVPLLLSPYAYSTYRGS